MRGIGLALLLAGCNSIARHPAQGRVASVDLRTTVDSELARHYLEGDRAHGSFDAEIGRLHACYDAQPLDRVTLQELAEETSPDFAALYFVRRILAVPRHRRMQERFRAHVDDLREARRRGPVRFADAGDDFVTVFVPGLLYRQKPETKSDLAEPRALLESAGLKTAFVPVPEAGTVEENGAVVAAALRKLRRAGRKIVVVSTSKGGADVAHAIGTELAGEDRTFLRGWVSIGGVLRGSPFIDHNLRGPRRWLATLVARLLVRVPMDMVRSMSASRSRKRLAGQSFPPHLRIVHFVAVPVSGSVLPEVRRSYKAMRRFGPNDGMTLLPDQLLPSGDIVLAIGVDHWFRDPEIDLKTLALARLINELMNEPRQPRRGP